LGTRELLIRGLNPYGPQVSEEIQMAYYGHIVVPSNLPGHAVIDEQRFAYPIYVVFFMAPAVYFDFDQVRRWVPFILALMIALSVLLCLDILRWRLPWQGAAALVLLTLGSPQIVQGLRLRQLGLLVGFLIVLAVWCLTKNWPTTAGMVLAFSTIKPQLVILPMACFIIWVLGEWRNRWQLLAGFFGSMAVLIGLGELMLPGWPSSFVAGLQAYRRYAPATSLLQVGLGKSPSAVISCVLVLMALFLAWRQRRCLANSQEFAFTLAVFLLAETIALPLLPPYNQILLFIPAIMVLRDWEQQPRFLRAAFASCLCWPWIASLTLLLAPAKDYSIGRVPLIPSVAALFIPLLLIPMIATRWPAAVRYHERQRDDGPL
jgi:hypothetical protein